MAQYINAGGVARKVTGRYEKVGGVARSVRKAYTAVSGAARLYFSGGISWRKWSCEVETTYEYVETDKGVGETLGGDSCVSTNYKINAYADYGFAEDTGFYGIDGIGRVPAADAVGYYQVQDTDVYTIDSVEETVYNGEDMLQIYKTRVAAANDYSDTEYRKGTTDYGTVYAEEGQLPEDGSLAAGSVTGSWCVVRVDGTYYYYEREETA